jgi:tRNA(His) 5'-end guanylyltransferase
MNNLGERMKEYERVTDVRLINRIPVLVRIDGKAFHTFTRGFMKPYDKVLMNAMQRTMKYLCEHIEGCVLGYTQSDEISLVIWNSNPFAEPWFDNKLQKITSITASMATWAFNMFFREEQLKYQYSIEEESYYYKHMNALNQAALFDSRAYNMPMYEVENYFIWRQQDCTRNAVQMAARTYYSHKEVQNKDGNELQELLFQKGINFNDYPEAFKRGSCCIKIPTEVETSKGMAVRNKWDIDKNIPIFTADRSYIKHFAFRE